MCRRIVVPVVAGRSPFAANDRPRGTYRPGLDRRLSVASDAGTGGQDRRTGPVRYDRQPAAVVRLAGQRFAQRRNADRLPHPAGFVARNARNRLGRPVGQRRNSGRPQRSRPVCRQGTGARQNLLLESDDFQQRQSAAVVGRQGVPHGRFADRIRHAGLPARKNGQRLTENDPKTLRSARFRRLRLRRFRTAPADALLARRRRHGDHPPRRMPERRTHRPGSGRLPPFPEPAPRTAAGHTHLHRKNTGGRAQHRPSGRSDAGLSGKSIRSATARSKAMRSATARVSSAGRS